MTPAEILASLVDIAREAGLEVRALPARGAADADLAPRSGVCRVRGRLLVLLSAADSVEDRTHALVHALRSAGPEALEGRWIPPAVRERIEDPVRGRPAGPR